MYQYLSNAELREGKQHCQSGTPEFLSETIAAAKQMTRKSLLFRMDSGNDALEKNVASALAGSAVEIPDQA